MFQMNDISSYGKVIILVLFWLLASMTGLLMMNIANLYTKEQNCAKKSQFLVWYPFWIALQFSHCGSYIWFIIVFGEIPFVNWVFSLSTFRKGAF